MLEDLMTRHWQPSIWLSVLLLAVSCLANSSPSNSIKRATTLSSIYTSHKLPGLAALGLPRNRSLQSSAVGFRKQGADPFLTKTDKFHLGSNTKAMTATLLAMMIENGTFSWDTTLSEALSIPMAQKHRNTTLAMLTAHRSGITGEVKSADPPLWQQLYYDYREKPVEGRRAVAESVLGNPPDITPDTLYSYSNTNYMIIGHIIDQHGPVWEDLINERLWMPLGMNECGFGTPPESSVTAIENPWPHQESTSGPPVPVTPDFLSDNPPALGPAGTVHCSMPSYAKFLALHLDGFNGLDTSLLKSSSFQALHTPYPGQNYTSGGWIIANNRRFGGSYLWHTGSNVLNYALAILAPGKDTAFASLTNVGGTEADSGTYEVALGWFTGSLRLEESSTVTASSTLSGPSSTNTGTGSSGGTATNSAVVTSTSEAGAASTGRSDFEDLIGIGLIAGTLLMR